MIDSEEKIERFEPSPDVERVENTTVKGDLINTTDTMVKLTKERGGE